MTDMAEVSESPIIETSKRLESAEAIRAYRELLGLESGDVLPRFDSFPTKITVQSPTIIEILQLSNRFQRMYQGLLPLELVSMGHPSLDSIGELDSNDWKRDGSGIFWSKALPNEGLGFR